MCSVILLIPCAATAAGLGRLTVLSALGQPLHAEVELLSAQKGETITGKLSSIDTYQQASVPFNAALVGTRVTLERRPNGQPYLKLTTPRPVYEPFAELLIELNSENGKITRQYTVLLDPPGYGRSAAELPPPVVAPPTVRAPAPTQETRAAPPAADAGGPVTTQESRVPLPAPDARASLAAQPSPAPAAQELPAPAAAAPVAPAEAGVPGPAAAARAAPSAKAAARPAPPVAPATSGFKQYGPVKRGETLGRIAGIVKPDGATLEQTLVGLFRQNPDAFIKKNMNLVKSGRILKVPEASEMSAVPQREAAHEVHLQVADFNSFRNRVADRAANAPEGGSVTSGRIGAARVADNASAGPRDTVKLSRGDTGAKGAAKGASDRVRALEEEAVAREKALADANERIAQLEKTIKDMQRLAEMKGAGKAPPQSTDKAGAAPQTAPAAKGPSPGPVAVAPLIPAPPAVKAPEAVAPAPPAAKAPAPEMAKATPPVPQAEPAAPAAKPKPPAAPKPAVVPTSEPDFIDTLMSDPLYLAAAGGAVVVLGGLALVAVRRRAGGNDRLVKISPTLGSESDLLGPPADAATPVSASEPAPTPVPPAPTLVPSAPKPSSLAPDRPAIAPTIAPVAAAPARAAAPASDDNDLDFNERTRPAPAPVPKSTAAAESTRQPPIPPRVAEPSFPAFDQAKAPPPPKPQAAAAPKPQSAPAPKPQPTPIPTLRAPEPTFTALHKGEPPRVEPSLADFSLDIPAAGPADAAATRETAASDFNMDFNLEPLPAIDAPPEIKKEPEAPAHRADPTDLEFKLDDLNLNFGGAAAPAAGAKDDHWYDVQQKFDLAKAYEEMGDKGGARDILQEVVKEGDSEQQAQAKKLLTSLG